LVGNKSKWGSNIINRLYCDQLYLSIHPLDKKKKKGEPYIGVNLNDTDCISTCSNNQNKVTNNLNPCLSIEETVKFIHWLSRNKRLASQPVLVIDMNRNEMKWK